MPPLTKSVKGPHIMANEIINQTESGRVNQQLQFEDLPFVVRHEWDGKSCGSNWHVPAEIERKDYAAGCQLGREWADVFVDFLRDNPATAGVALTFIVTGMTAVEETVAAKGVRVGFLHSLGQPISKSA
jgi:hypothetical protein